MPIARTLAALAIAAALALSAAPADERPTVSAASSSEPVIYQPDPDRAAALALRATTTTAPTTTTHYHPPTTTTRPAPAASGSNTSGDPYSEASWDRLAQCEAGGNWSTNTGNGYYGGLQFSLSSWQGVGGTGYPHEHSRSEQIRRSQLLWEQGGWNHWPGCSRKFGWI